MADIPNLPGGSGGNNPFEKKDLDIMDPEAKPQSSKKKTAADIAKDIKQKADDFRKTIDRISKVIKALGPWGCLIVLIIIILVGIVAFLVTIPGLTINKLKQIAQGMVDTVQSWFINEADAFTNEQQVVDLANYLEEMEYDLVGYGFIVPETTYTTGIPTYEEVKAMGYYYYETRPGDTNPRYYNESGAAYSGYYYNSLGIKIDNSTGAVTTESTYKDDYGIERSSEEIATSGKGKITGTGDVDTTLLRSYLLSDYRINVLRNDDETALKTVFNNIKTVFGGYRGAWAKGLIKLYVSENGKAERTWGFWDGFLWQNDISISNSSMSIRKGYFNNKMTYSIDGWADRYGMSLEFLLSLHIGTMAPELVNAMLQSFDTEVQVYLQSSGQSTIGAKYVDMLDAAATLEANGIDIEKVCDTLEATGHDIAGGLVTSAAAMEWVNSIAITKSAAQDLLINLPLTSPDNCTGSAQEYVVEDATYYTDSFLWFDTSSNALATYGITVAEDPDVYSEFTSYANYHFNDASGSPLEFNAEHVTQEIGTGNSNYLNDNFTWLGASSYGYGAADSDTMEAPIDKETFNTTVLRSSYSDYGSTITTYDNYQIQKVKQHRTWSSKVDDEEVGYEWIIYKYLVYKTGTTTETTIGGSTTSTDYDLDSPEWEDTVMVEFIAREKTLDELVDAGILEYDEENDTYTYLGPDSTKCSNNPSQTKCCTNCLRYVEAVVAALASVEDNDYSTYIPYIARVVGSWFRDTYFIIPDEADVAIREYANGVPGNTQKEVETQDGATAYRDAYATAHGEVDITGAYGTDSELVVVDEDYLAASEEYWTLYETKDDGDYQLYYLNPDGTTSNMKLEEFLETNGFDSKEAAEDAGHAFVKKAKTKNVTELTASEIDGVIWSAYEFGTSGASSGWLSVNRGENAKVDKVYDMVGDSAVNPNGGFYYSLGTTNTVTQIEDAQRSVTNATVKYLFKYRKYYIYDGTEGTALSIAKDKDAVIEWAKNTLNSKYGSNWGNHVSSELLGKYGRSALRQAYGGIVFCNNSESDQRDVAEQWLEWQLDMYYSGITNGCPSSDIVITDGLTTTLTIDGETVTREGDPRNPDLIATVNITKNSLNAFSILENTKTLAAEYAYRDFKELIVELNYFDKEDLSDKIDSVFTWVLPDISPMGWPVRPYDKQNSDYGALIESKDTYEYLKDSDYEVPEGPEAPEEPEEPETPSTSLDKSKIQFIGDSWIDGLGSSSVAESSYFYGVTGASAASSEMQPSTVNSHISSDASAIVLYLGVNNPSTTSQMTSLIDSLNATHHDIPIYVVQVTHVGSGYGSNAATLNSSIDSYNDTISIYCATKENVYYIQAASSVQDGSGLLNSDLARPDGLHLNSSNAYKTWYDAIMAGIDGANDGAGVSSFEGFSGDELVSSPVTGKVLESGTHKRINIYTGAEEDVGYIIIEALKSGIFDSTNVSNNSGDSGASNDDAAKGLNLFAEEYEDVCNGYTIMIDGFDVDLNTTDDEGNNGFYEQNEIMQLYNSDEVAERVENEQFKDDAPFFVDIGGEYYIKEGKYIGKTVVNGVPATPTEPVVILDGQEEYTGPADYIRILIKDTDYAVLDNVEDFFDIPEDLGSTISGIYGNLEAITESSSLEDKVRAAMTYYISQGFTAEAAAGIVGNAAVESTLSPTAANGTSYMGLYQWDTPGRWVTVTNWMTTNGYNQDSFAGQIRASVESGDRDSFMDWNLLKGLTNVEQAAEYWCVKYEGAIGGSGVPQWYGLGNNWQALDKRKQCAKNALQIYQGNAVGLFDGT